MARLLDQRRAIKLLSDNDWAFGRGGKHAVKMTKGGERSITLPRHHGSVYGKKLTAAIFKQAGIDPREGPWNSRSQSTRNPMASGPRSPSSRDASRQAEL
ncbi:MAG TPA: type II toxin-antitoxin system HicA family toxin [Solirubrobacteraceae bacterium]